MKKAFTIFSALMLSGIGFTAMASFTNPVVSPIQGVLPVTTTGVLEEITVDFGEWIQLNNENITATWPQGTSSLAAEVSGNNKLIIFGNDIRNGRDAGEYVITIGAGTVENYAGETNAEIVLNYTIQADLLEIEPDFYPPYSELKGSDPSSVSSYDPVWSPSELSEVEISFPNDEDFYMDFPFNSPLRIQYKNLTTGASGELNGNQYTNYPGAPEGRGSYGYGKIKLLLGKFVPGVYQFTIPNGFFGLKQTINGPVSYVGDITFVYAMSENSYMSETATIVEPSIVYTTEIENVVLSFGTSIYKGPNFNNIVVMTAAGNFSPAATISGSELTLDFSTNDAEVRYNGVYTIKLPEGCVEDVDGAINGTQSLYLYQYTATEYETVSPETGDVAAESLGQVILSFPYQMTKNPYCTEPVLVVAGGNALQVESYVNGSSLSLTVNGASDLAAGTTVTITVPQSYMYSDSGKAVNAATILTYTVADDVTPVIIYPSSLTVVNGSSETGIITLTWENVSKVAVNADCTEKIYLTLVDGTDYPITSSNISYNENNTEVYFNISKVAYDLGEYVLKVPQGYFLITDKSGEYVDALSAPVSYEFEMLEGGGSSGVNEIMGNSTYSVYNMQGVKVMEGTDLSGLAGGIYIINGKKVMIRK